MRKDIVIFSIIVIIMITVYFYLQPLNDDDIKVIIDGVDYDDEIFINDYDYSTLKGKKIELNMNINSDEFTVRDEIIQYNCTTLSEVWDIFSELKAPNVVAGFSKYLTNGSFCETASKYYGTSTNCSDVDEIGRNFGVLGNIQYSKVAFNVYRRNISGKDYLYVSKIYLRAGSTSSIWSMFVWFDDGDFYRVELRKYALK